MSSNIVTTRKNLHIIKNFKYLQSIKVNSRQLEFQVTYIKFKTKYAVIHTANEVYCFQIPCSFIAYK